MSNQAKKLTIGQIQKKFFEIPTYQRLYEWESIHIETLLDDIKKAWDWSKQYFIGNITTSKKSENGQEKFVLIDGQQRLTTLWFIGFYLASKGRKIWKNFILQNDKLRIAMPIRDKEEKALKELAMKNHTIKPNENGEINLYAYLPSDIHQKIINAFECIEKWFNVMFGKYVNGKLEIDDLKRFKCFSLFIYTKVCFVFVELAENTDLNRFFVRMNNRGKQLEKHEILKARLLSVIQQGGGDEWQKYAKIWDLCSDMNKYIFQSANDRKVLNSVSDDNEGWNIDRIIKEFNDKNTKNKDNDDTPDKVESIIDFPTFLLHCYKLWVAKKCNENKIPKEITITKDNLLEIMWDNQANKGKNKEIILDDKFIFNDKNNKNGQAKANCKEFIESMLRYRVLFDYFVIKSDVVAKGGNSYKIMRLSENKGNYSLPENSKKGELTSGVLHDLVMIQNYLRVARSGDRQNYHHWLTPFLAYLDTQKDKILVLEGNALDLDFTKWKTEKEGKDIAECESKTNIIAKRFSNEINDLQNELIVYLSELDTALSKEQLGTNGENNLLPISNEAIKATLKSKTLSNINWNFKSITDKWKQYTTKDDYKEWAFLNNGTGTPHYWFYRLEYYLWKWRVVLDKEDFEAQFKKKFGDKFNNLKSMFSVELETHNFQSIAKNFYFRNLNSVEHIQPQSKAKEKDWQIHDESTKDEKRDIDCFGNLALLSVGFNSSLSNQDNADKRLDLQKKINKSEVESLKLWLVYANYPKDENWTCANAQAHQKQMLDILIESLGLNPNDSQDSNNSQGK